MHERGVRGYADVARETASELETLADEMTEVKVASVTPYELKQAARLLRAGVETVPGALVIVRDLISHGRAQDQAEV